MYHRVAALFARTFSVALHESSVIPAAISKAKSASRFRSKVTQDRDVRARPLPIGPHSHVSLVSHGPWEEVGPWA
jgi:hypothetical protein